MVLTLSDTPRSLTTTRAPRAPSSSAYSFPRPLPAPVTIATRPANVSAAEHLPTEFTEAADTSEADRPTVLAAPPIVAPADGATPSFLWTHSVT
eukprot:2363878-Prymnesium_polylepis.1